MANDLSGQDPRSLEGTGGGCGAQEPLQAARKRNRAMSAADRGWRGLADRERDVTVPAFMPRITMPSAAYWMRSAISLAAASKAASGCPAWAGMWKVHFCGCNSMPHSGAASAMASQKSNAPSR